MLKLIWGIYEKWTSKDTGIKTISVDKEVIFGRINSERSYDLRWLHSTSFYFQFSVTSSL